MACWKCANERAHNFWQKKYQITKIISRQQNMNEWTDNRFDLLRRGQHISWLKILYESQSIRRTIDAKTILQWYNLKFPINCLSTNGISAFISTWQPNRCRYWTCFKWLVPKFHILSLFLIFEPQKAISKPYWTHQNRFVRYDYLHNCGLSPLLKALMSVFTNV